MLLLIRFENTLYELIANSRHRRFNATSPHFHASLFILVRQRRFSAQMRFQRCFRLAFTSTLPLRFATEAVPHNAPSMSQQ